MMTLAQAQALLPGSRLFGSGDIALSGVGSDSRRVQRGELFVALRGERFDGHAYLRQALVMGAGAVLAEEGLSDAVPGLQVPDSLAALQQLAAAWRATMQPSLIAVVGSNGKTTVTQMTAAILRAWLGDAALATQGNLNNHIGLPLTLLRLRQSGPTPHRAAVVELGMNHPGEIALLAGLAAPTVAVITNAQREHQEFMASVEAVARENGQVIHALGAQGTVVLPLNDAHAPLWREMAGTRPVLGFGSEQAEVFAEQATWAGQAWQLVLRTPAGRVPTSLAQPGLHNVHNAQAAAAAALAAGAPAWAVAQGLAAFRPVAGRSAVRLLHQAGRDITLVDDSYNANPDSVLAAIEVLAALPSPRWLVLGDMGEVGDAGAAFHAEVGARARERGIEHFWAAGALMQHAAAHRHFADTPALLAALQETPQQAPQAASVLVKGSRFMGMERVVQALVAAAEGAQGPAGGEGTRHAA